MDQEFSMQKQDFTIIKEKIIKTNELLLLYKEKTDTLNKAKNAFKQLKSKYDAATNEITMLKMDNERLNFSLKTLKPKFEQCEKDLIEVRADYKRTEERYQQNMIESQLSISNFEDKVKHCTCEKDLSLSPSKKRNSSTEKIKDLKEKCKELREVETNLKNENDHFKLKNRELKMEKLKNVKVLEDFTAKNMILQRDLTALKNKVQQMELASNDHVNLQLSVTSLKQRHEKEIDSLKMEISKLSLDNQRIKYLELECKNLKEQISRQELQKMKKSDSCVQTEVSIENDHVSRNDSLNVEKIKMLELKCEELEKSLINLKNNAISKDIGVKAKIDHVQTLTVWEDDSSDFDDSVSDIFSEMILPKALSPLSFSPRTTKSSTSPFQPLSPLDEDLPQQKKFVPIPNIVITPPTPGVEIAGLSNMVFPILTENSENTDPSKEKINLDRSPVANTVLTKETKKKPNENVKNLDDIQPSCNKKLVTAKDSSPTVEEKVLFKHPGHIEKYGLLKCKPSTPIIDKHELLDDNKISKKNNQTSHSITSIATSEGEMPTQGLLENALLSRESDNSSTHTILVPTSKTSVSTETESGKISRNLQEGSLNLKEGRRKFWLPYNVNSFVKLRKKRRPVKRTKVTNNYKEMSNQPAQSDTILNALRTLQHNNINFTISNESIPLAQPYNCYSLLTPPKTEPKSITRKVTNTFSYSLECWNKQCTVHNTQMLLRKVQNEEEEEELLGFFSVKDEIITPAVSRMAVLDKPNAFNAQDLVSQLLSGIKELVDVKRNESSGTRRRRRAKSKNRWSDFHSETETELEKLFRTSADVLGRNRRFLAAAKEQSFKSNEESMFESGSDAMADSGLVTGTPQDDSDSLSVCSQNELGEEVASDVFSSTVRTGENSAPDVVLPNHNENALLKNDENFAGFSSPNAFSCVSKFGNISSNESALGNSTIPKFVVCPDMISPIASSKGSPDTFQGSSTPLKIPALHQLSRTSPDCFKQPFCPIMISPMASSKNYPVSQTSKALQHTYEDNLDPFKMPLAPPTISPLASLTKAYQENRSETTETIKENDNSASVRLSQISDNVDISKLSNIDLQSLNAVNFTEILAETEYKSPMQDCHDNKHSSNGNKISSICQRITFDSVTDNDHLSQSVDLVSMEIESPQQSVSKSLVTGVNDIQKTFAISKDDNVLCINSTIQGNENKDRAEDGLQSANRPLLLKDNKLGSLVKLDDSSFHIDLSLKSSELNFTLDNISISQLEVTCPMNNNLGKPNEVHVNLKERLSLDSQETCNLVKKEGSIKTANSSCPERRYSLRGKSQYNVKQDQNLELKAQNNDLSATECSVECFSPRTRAAKRKLEDEAEDENNQSISTRLSKLAKREEMTSKDAFGTDSESAVDITTKQEELAGPLKRKRGRPRKVDKLAVLKYKTNNDSQVQSEIISKEENGIVKEMGSNNVLGTASENAGDISTKREELVSPLVRKRGRPRKVYKFSMSQNKNISGSQVISGQQDVKSDIIQKEANGNVEEMICKNVLGTDSESTGDISKKCYVKLTKEDSIEARETKDKKQQQEVKRCLRNRRKTSANLNTDMSVDLFDWELDRATTKNLKKETDSCEQSPLEQVKINDKESATDVVRTDGLDSSKKTECLKAKQIGCKSRKIISKEFIAESESDCDVPSQVHLETIHQASKKIQKDVLGSEQEQASSNSTSIINTHNNIVQKNDFSTSKKTTETASGNAEDKIRKIEMPLRSDNETKSYRERNYPFKKKITLEIQDILRNLSDKASQSSSYVENDTTPVNSKEVSHPSEKDLFGDSDSEDETKKDDLKIIAKPKPQQRPAKQNLKRKMLNQVKGLNYATGKYKDRDIVKKHLEGKPKELPCKSVVSEETCAKSLPAKEKEVKKIKIVQNILISKGRAFNLLSSNGKGEQPDSASLSLNATEPIRPPPFKVNQGEPLRTYQRKKSKLEQNISSTSSTPVDILSQVMQGMVKTGPKTARKKVFTQTRYLSSAQSGPSGFNNVGLRTSSVQQKLVHENVGKPCSMEKPLTEENTAAFVKNDNVPLDCPKSPDVVEVPDRLPKLIPTEQPVKLPGSKVRTLIDKLMVFSNEVKMVDDVIQEFAFQDMTFMVEIILDKLCLDYHDKADNSFPPSPPMTSTQRILLGFLLKLDRSTHPGIEDRFLRLAEQQLFNKYSAKLEIIDPITRLYTALCKLRYDLNRIRRFICEGFYFMGDLAIPMFFTLLTMWGEVLPMMKSERSDHLLSKVIVQICYLKDCNQPGYNLMPLRDLLKKYYGYPNERWKCEDIFKEIMVEYIRNPSIRISDFTLLLFLKNNPTRWSYQQVKETIIPVYTQARDSNPNLKATLVILLANICCAFNQYEEYDWSVILEMDRWFIELDRDDIDPILKRSIHLARARLPRRVRIRKRNKAAGNGNDNANKADNQDNLIAITENCANNLPLEESSQENDGEDSLRTDISRVTVSSEDENSENTKNSVNTELSLVYSSQSNVAEKIQNAGNFSNEEENAVQSSSSDIEF